MKTHHFDYTQGRRVLERITKPSVVGSVMVLAGLAAFLFLGSIIAGGIQAIERVTLPSPTLTLLVGIIGFAIFFPWYMCLWACSILLRAVRILEEKGEENLAKR